MNDSRFKSPVSVIILSIITCGIYALYWIYKTSQELQDSKPDYESTSPGIELLLCIVCAPYAIYWFYKYGKVIYEIQLEKNLVPTEDNAILYLILCIFGLSIIAIAIMQSSMNKMWLAESK